MTQDLSDQFHLRCELLGHSKDVRSLVKANICNVPSIISCSRDFSVRVWQETGDSLAYDEKMCLKGHEKFVSAVACMVPHENCREGVIFSASLDSTIRAYNASTGNLLYTLKDHTDQITCLAVDQSRALLISGSADRSIRIWRGAKCVKVLSGHLHIVWTVFVGHLGSQSIKGNLPVIISGSADKTLKLWSGGNCERTFTGHTDSVRCAVELSEGEFLSAGNDATIRRWNKETGDCLMTYHSEDYVYSIDFQEPYDFFVTGGEDKCLKVWHINTGDVLQSIKFPAQSIWAVAVLENGDVVSGSSDATIRIFSRDAHRCASADQLQALARDSAAFGAPKESAASSEGRDAVADEIGGVRIADLPGVEALREPGRRDGQTKMVRRFVVSSDGGGSSVTTVELHQWSATDAQWTKVGDVMGEKKAETTAEKASNFDGQKYDFVFDVDIEDGKPPLKLPYNMVDDPWHAAQNFINKNMLPQSYLETVADFITKNAHGASLPIFSNIGSNDAYVDPFTGAARYTPEVNLKSATENCSDPFTGQRRYTPTSAAFDPAKLDPKRPRGEEIPMQNYVLFSSSVDFLLGLLFCLIHNLWQSIEFLFKDVYPTPCVNVKLKENNAEVEMAHKLDSLHLAEVELIIEKKAPSDLTMLITALDRMLQWPRGLLPPALDVLRLALLHQAVCDRLYFDQSAGVYLVDCLCRFLSTECDSSAQPPPLAFRVLIARAFANSLARPLARRVLFPRLSTLADLLTRVGLFLDDKPNAQTAAAAFLANCALALSHSQANKEFEATTNQNGADGLNGHCSIENDKRSFADWLFQMLNENSSNLARLNDQALFYLLQCVVTVLWGDLPLIEEAGHRGVKGSVVKLKDLVCDERSKNIARSIEHMF